MCLPFVYFMQNLGAITMFSPFLPSQHCTFFQGRLVILLSLHAKTLHSLIKIFQDSLDFGRIRGVLEDRRRKVIVRQVLNQIWKMYLFMTKILPK